MWQSTKWVDWYTGARIWRCRNCSKSHYQTEEPPQGLKVPPKILYLDIETALMRVFVYDLYDESNKHISKDMIERSRFIVNWAAAWVTPEEYTIKGRIKTGVVTQKEAKRQNDKRIMQRLFDLMDESDYICGHNVKNFDEKIIKWRFLKHKMGYPAESKKVDTLTLARRTKPESRGLEHISVELGGKPKKGLRAHEWREIVEKGTPRLLNKANKYCVGDVKEGVTVLRHLVKAEEQSGKVVFK